MVRFGGIDILASTFMYVFMDIIYIDIYPRCCMYGIFSYIYAEVDPSVDKYSIHGAPRLFLCIYVRYRANVVAI